MPYLTCPACRLRLHGAMSTQSLSEVGARMLYRELPWTPGAMAGARHTLDRFHMVGTGGG